MTIASRSPQPFIALRSLPAAYLVYSLLFGQLHVSPQSDSERAQRFDSSHITLHALWYSPNSVSSVTAPISRWNWYNSSIRRQPLPAEPYGLYVGYGGVTMSLGNRRGSTVGGQPEGDGED